MNKLIFFVSQMLFVWTLIFNFSYARDPELRIVRLDCETDLIASPIQIDLIPGDSLQFVADNGEFAIFIRNAAYYFEIDSADIQIHLNSSGTPISDIYVVREGASSPPITYIIYCITDDNWPEAPPRIVINVP